MATVVADTSFLFSLFGNDAHSAATRGWVQQARVPITITALASVATRARDWKPLRGHAAPSDAATSNGVARTRQLARKPLAPQF